MSRAHRAPRALAAGALLLVAAAGGCHQDASGRKDVFARAGRMDTTIAAGAVVRDLRTPPDSQGIIYTRPTPLQIDTGQKAGTPVSAPAATSGGSKPDSAARVPSPARPPRP